MYMSTGKHLLCLSAHTHTQTHTPHTHTHAHTHTHTHTPHTHTHTHTRTHTCTHHTHTYTHHTHIHTTAISCSPFDDAASVEARLLVHLSNGSVHVVLSLLQFALRESP